MPDNRPDPGGKVARLPARDPGPVNYDAEQALLGAILANNGVFANVDPWLKPEHFADPLHGRVFQAIGRLIEQGRVANPVTLKALFDQDGALAEIGGAQYLADLAMSVVTVLNAHDYGRAIVDLYQRREMIAFAREFEARAAAAGLPGEAASLLGDMEGRLAGLAEETADQRPTVTIHDAAYTAIEQAERAMKAGGLTGVTTGIRDLDQFLGGLQPGLNILAGRPSMGKTTLAENIAMAAARDSLGRTNGALAPAVLFYSLEMGATELGQKALAAKTGIAADRLQRGQIDQDEIAALIEAAPEFHRLPLIIDDAGRMTPQSMAARARRIHRKQGLRLIILDHIQLAESGAGRDENAVQRVSAITRALKMLAKELGIPILALSQLSRKVEDRDDKRPQLADLRESGSIEQDADLVAFLFREGYYLEKAEPQRSAFDSDQKFSAAVLKWTGDIARCQGTAEIIIRKNRMGPCGTKTVFFDPATSRFTDLQRGA